MDSPIANVRVSSVSRGTHTHVLYLILNITFHMLILLVFTSIKTILLPTILDISNGKLSAVVIEKRVSLPAGYTLNWPKCRVNFCAIKSGNSR